MTNVSSQAKKPELYVIRNQRGAPPHIIDSHPVMLFDGECVLCRRLIHFLIRADSGQRILLATVQSLPGQDLLRWAGLPTESFSTVAFIKQGQVSLRSEAFFNALAELGWPWRALAVFRLLPRRWRDALYTAVARNRYQWFGQLAPGTEPPDDRVGRRYLTQGKTPRQSGQQAEGIPVK